MNHTRKRDSEKTWHKRHETSWFLHCGWSKWFKTSKRSLIITSRLQLWYSSDRSQHQCLVWTVSEIIAFCRSALDFMHQYNQTQSQRALPVPSNRLLHAAQFCKVYLTQIFEFHVAHHLCLSKHVHNGEDNCPIISAGPELSTLEISD